MSLEFQYLSQDSKYSGNLRGYIVCFSVTKLYLILNARLLYEQTKHKHDKIASLKVNNPCANPLDKKLEIIDYVKEGITHISHSNLSLSLSLSFSLSSLSFYLPITKYN